ncbi:MAG: peptide deformylase [Oscillospiraceae bacterium]
MALRNILTERDPILRKRSRPVETYDERLHALLDDLAETLADANGAGLAAPQVGILRRAVIVDAGDGVTELVNPKIIYESAEKLNEAEGCLSSPGEWGMVLRPKKVVAAYFDRFGNPHEITGEGLLARAICHEIDHLDGRLFKDLASRMLDPKEIEEE